MVKKEFLDFYVVRNNGLLLAKKILNNNFFPDVIYTVLRGGVYLSNIMSEFFQLKTDKKIDIAAVRAYSYNNVKSNSAVELDGWTLHPTDLKKDVKVLLVDDIFDSGKTLNFLAQTIVDAGVSRDNFKMAVHDYKEKKYDKSQQELIYKPDYFCRKFVIENQNDDNWINYLSHELKGVSEEEFFKNFSSKFSVLKDFKLY